MPLAAPVTRATAHALSKAGCKLILCDVNVQGLRGAERELKDGNVRAFDGDKEIARRVTVVSPCEAGVSGPDGGWVAHYTLKDGKLLSGLGDAGSRDGSSAVACVSAYVFSVDESGGCKRWERSHFSAEERARFHMAEWKSEAASCALGNDGVLDFFSVKLWGTTSTRVPVLGTAIVDAQIIGTHAQAFPTLDAAKDALRARKGG